MANNTSISAKADNITTLTQVEKIEHLHQHYNFREESPVKAKIFLPRYPDNFTNRVDELNYVLNRLEPGKVVTLCGTGGIGKSSIASKALWQLTNRGSQVPAMFPDGVLWHDFYTEPNTNIALEQIARIFGEEPKPSPFDAALRALSNRKVLILLDGTESADNIHNVIKVTGQCCLIITSRDTQDAIDELLEVKTLELKEALKLFNTLVKNPVQQSIAKEICQLIGCLPLAVRIAGNYLNQSKEEDKIYLEWLKESPLEALSHGKRQLQSVYVLLQRSFF
jgi:energy-coupling factor transporter ATP-binding protein EcfA2